MNIRRAALFVIFGLQLLAIGPLVAALGKNLEQHNAVPIEQTAPSCLSMGQGLLDALPAVPTPVTPFQNPSPGVLTHPCPGMAPEPAFSGLSPLSIAYVPNMCDGGNVFNAGYGDIGVWQAAGHSYVMISGFARVLFHIWNVDDPYNPVLLRTQSLPSGASASLSIFPFKKGADRYMSVTTRGSSPGCGFYIYNVNDPANPTFVSRKQGTDWCTVHEHFISTDANGDADYAWLTMSAESGSGYKVVVLDLSDLANPVETGRYQRADSNGSIFSHDVTVVGERVFLSHWTGGSIIFDKNTLAHSTNPAPLNPMDSIRPSGFRVHHSWPTSDGNHLFIEDEFENSAANDKIKMFNISNILSPFYETGIVGFDTAQTSQAHNLKVRPIAPGQDLLLDGWYLAGTRAFTVDYSAGGTPIITQSAKHQLHATAGPNFGGVWGVDYLPCTVRGVSTTCLYSSDLEYGLTVDALGYNAQFDPYLPEVQVAQPTEEQVINSCKFTMNGTSHDYWSGVQQMQVSIDNGDWLPAQGTDNWTYHWIVGADGTHQVRVRGVDGGNNVDLKTINVTVSADCPSTTATPMSTFTPTFTSTSTPMPTDTATASSTATNMPTGTLAQPSATVTTQASMTAVATVCAVQFNDVAGGSTFYPFVRCLACEGVMSGYVCGGVGEPCPGQYFRPNGNITRGQLAKIVANTLGLSFPPNGQLFQDVPVTNVFYPYISRLTSLSPYIIQGYPCGTRPDEPCGSSSAPYFRPVDNVTRGQLAKIVVNAGGITGSANTQIFADVSTSSVFFTPIQSLAVHGYISGYACGGPDEPCDAQNRPYFRPGNSVTRGQASKIVASALAPSCDTAAGTTRK